MQRCLVLNFWFYYIFFTFMASFIYDTGLPWSFFLENIVFQKNQTKNQTFHRKHFVSLLPGWGNKTYQYFCKAHIYIDIDIYSSQSGMCTQERVFVLLNFIFCVSFEKRNIYGIVEKYMQRCLVLNFWFYYIFFTFMASFIYDTGLPWSFFLENIVFQKNQTKNKTFHRKHFVSLLPEIYIYIYIFFV